MTTRDPANLAARRRAPVGAPPGTLIASESAAQSRMEMICYGPGSDEHLKLADCSMADVRKAKDRYPVLWLDVEGLANLALVEEIAEEFKLHLLSIEDVINVHQRPKVEEYPDQVYVVLRLPPDGSSGSGEQISLFIGTNYVITFQEREGDCFDAVRQRIGNGRRIVSSGPDYLAYALIDACVDAYFPVLEDLGERVEDMEDRVLADPQPSQSGELHAMKRELLQIRRAIWPMRELLNSLMRNDNPNISDTTQVYLRDVYDHTIQLMDIVETYREIASGLLDVYLSSQSARLNEVMKFLTVIATIFIPLSFLAGLWGMNFDPTASQWNMPELKWVYGYPLALAVMTATALGLVGYFRYKKWL